MEKETKKRKDGAEKELEKKEKEIGAKCMNIQEVFARASISTKSQTTVYPALLLKHQDQHH